MYSSTLVLLCYAIFAFVGCTQQTPVDTTTANQTYYPLTVGNWWLYTTLNQDDEYWTRRVMRQEKLGNEVYYYVVDSAFYKGKFSWTSTDTLTQNAAKVIWHNSSQMIDFTATSQDTNDIHGFVSQRHDSISVLAGTFKDAVSISYPAAAFDGMPFEIYAQNIGMVQVSGFRYQYQLKRAEVNGRKYEW